MSNNSSAEHSTSKTVQVFNFINNQRRRRREEEERRGKRKCEISTQVLPRCEPFITGFLFSATYLQRSPFLGRVRSTLLDERRSQARLFAGKRLSSPGFNEDMPAD